MQYATIIISAIKRNVEKNLQVFVNNILACYRSESVIATSVLNIINGENCFWDVAEYHYCLKSGKGRRWCSLTSKC